MRISVTIFIILISTYIVNASVLDPVIENVVHLKASKPPSGVAGIWKKKTIWKPRWVKEWKSAKVMKPVWRKVWSPIQIREWVPIPKPPPGWDSISTPLAPVHLKSPKAPLKGALKGSSGHDSYGVQSSTKTLLWDPIPYPESQQPPPPPFPQPLYNADVSCDKGRCDSTFSQTMSHQQILEIIGQKYQTPDYYQNPEYSETVNHLSRLSPGGNTWTLPRSRQNFQPDGGLQNYQQLSEFLVPPKFQSLIENNFPIQRSPISDPVGHSFERQIQNNFRQWIPLPPQNKLKELLITEKPRLYKFQTPNVEPHTENDDNNPHKGVFRNSNNDSEEKSINQTQTSITGQQPKKESDLIQEAQLVGEFHYSEFDLPHLKPQLTLRKKEVVTDKPQQSKTTLEKENVERSVIEHKPKQTRKEIAKSQVRAPEVHNTQDNLRGPKKNLSNPFSSNTNINFRQQEATVKEIYPIFKIPENLTSVKARNLTSTAVEIPEKSILQNHPLKKLTTSAGNTSEFQQETERHPIFEIPKRINPISIPPDLRFFQPPEIRLQEKSFPSNNSIRLEPVTAKSENFSFDESGRVRLVFATTSDANIHSEEEIQKTTTTEPYEIVFSSSLLSTTEKAAAKDSLIVVTPANSNKS